MDLSGSDFLMENCFWVGIHPSITKGMMDYMVDIVGDFYKMKGSG